MPQSTKLRELTTAPVSSELCLNAALILKHSHDCASALLNAFNRARNERGGAGGMTTDEEQDILRAMLVMAAAGLDAVAKQLIRDALPALVKANLSVRQGLERFVSQQIRGASDAPEVSGGRHFLARVLSAPSQQSQVIEEYIQELTGGSLQSVDELARTAAALGLDATRQLGLDFSALREVFRIRNSIVHELDMNLAGDRRKRNLRRRSDMIKHTNVLLQLAESLRDAVDKALAEAVE